MTDFIEVYDTEILLVEDESGSVLEYVGSAIIVGGAVQKVNGQTGDITLTAADVAADPVGSAEAVRTDLQLQIDDKADTATVNQQIDGINQQLPNFATQTYVLTALTPKASIVYVDNAVAAKADALATSQALATKATTVQLNEVKALAESNELKVSTKAEQADLEALGQVVSEKVDQATYNTFVQACALLASRDFVIEQINGILGGVSIDFDTLKEIADRLQLDSDQFGVITSALSKRIRFDAPQTLTSAEQQQARDNINAEAKGTAQSLVAGITPASIGAATTAQGTKADTAIQSADLAPVALSGSFSDLVNKSSLFNLVYSAYAIGSNVVIAATDTLGQMLGKLQGQISANSTAIGTKADATSTLQAINTKEPAISTGTTSQYWRGDKTWRDFATDVRGTVLTSLSTATATAIVATDTVIVGLGKAQAQITANSTAISNNTAALTPIPRRTGAAKWYLANRWYDATYPWPGGAVLTTLNPTVGVQYYIRCQALESFTMTQVAVNVSAAGEAGAACQLGVYSAGADGEPLNLLVKSSNLDTTSTGPKTLNCSLSFTAGDIFYLSMLTLEATARYTALPAAALPIHSASTLLTVGNNFNKFRTGITDMPATAPTTFGESANNGQPRVCFML